LPAEAFAPGDRAAVAESGFCLFLVAELEAIMPLYGSQAVPLVSLDAGYMAELLTAQAPGTGLRALQGVVPRALAEVLDLEASHVLVQGFCGGGTLGREAGLLPLTGDPAFMAHAHRLSALEAEPQSSTSVNFLSPEDRAQFEQQQRHLRTSPEATPRVALSPAPVDVPRYRRRACQRHYRSAPLSQGHWLAFLREAVAAGATGQDELALYVYLKADAVEGMAEGLYYYDRQSARLQLQNASPGIDRSCQFFYNRDYFDAASFSLFWLSPIGDEADRAVPLLQARLAAGRLGQRLLSTQSAYEVGLCPVGGTDFDRIRDAFGVAASYELVHCLLGGTAEPQAAALQPQPVSVSPQALAIVGLSGRYPGADNLDQYWQNLKSGQSQLRPWPEARKHLLWSELSPPEQAELPQRGGFIDDIECFDHWLFQMAPAEARLVDPQERLFLEAVWTCLEGAGYTARSLKQSAPRVGVFVGVRMLAYPFRPFFLLTGAYGAVLIAAWAGLLGNALSLPLGVAATQWHAHEMLFGIVPAAIAGFLLTAMCNWTGAAPLRGNGLLALVSLWVAGRAALWFSGVLPLWLVALVDLAFLPALAVYATRVLLRHGNRRNLVLTVMLGLLTLANLMMHLGFMGYWPRGGLMGEVLALDLIAVVMIIIGGRITPAFTAGWLQRQGRDPRVVQRSENLDRLAMWTALATVPADLVWGAPWLGALAAGVAALVNGWRLWRWRGWHAADEPLLWILHLGVAWVVVAFLFKAVTPWLGLSPFLWMHAMGVGAIGTLILGVMTRVSLGHTGRPLTLPRYAPWIYGAIVVATLARLIAAVTMEWYWLGIWGSAAAWVFAFVLFIALYWPILSRPRADGRPG